MKIKMRVTKQKESQLQILTIYRQQSRYQDLQLQLNLLNKRLPQKKIEENQRIKKKV
jgi:hypothetical protein